MSSEDLVSRLRHHLSPILKDRPVQLAYLHGSAARGERMPSSDLDIALVATRELSPQQRLGLMLDVSLEVDKHCDLPEADVRVINDAPLLLRGRVVSEGIPLYSRDESGPMRYETMARMR